MGMMLALLLIWQEGAPPASPPPPPQPCASEAHAAFDYWLGEWEVYATARPEQKIADSRIERLYGGCAVRENWMPLTGKGGGSLNSLRADGRWHQRWIGANGETVDFVGGPDASGDMVMTGWWADYGGPGQHRFVRMSFLRQDDGSVRQLGEISTDHGASYTSGYDLTYRPRN
ncbi:hypothetical protein [Sphingomicrobium astaxanthinifaciens]|uniref:hypothetical protein n=1 Tax=Sphingomicrobium astaxanthinifaciens TaxID=1227949 RepID=UPI001FCAD168|nr:hypothetical protein [Sphingomicrobium astaxanthinifaciens]MCJ7420237.1 hypothetical protein [Sphingomicrobium astaxanthinifaciens]